MKNFKKIMSACHTQNKTCLHDLYTDRQVYYSSVSSSEQPVEDEKIYDYRSVPFQFTGTGLDTPPSSALSWRGHQALITRELMQRCTSDFAIAL